MTALAGVMNEQTDFLPFFFFFYLPLRVKNYQTYVWALPYGWNIGLDAVACHPA